MKIMSCSPKEHKILPKWGEMEFVSTEIIASGSSEGNEVQNCYI